MTLYDTMLMGEEPRQEAKTGSPLPAWGETNVVGKKVPRVDGYDRVSGSAIYTHDIVLPGMLHAAILRCPYPHAKLTGIEVNRARQMPGVHAVLYDEDPGTKIPWYFGEKGAMSRLFDPSCKFEGNEIAAVAAETPHQAWDAVKAIPIEFSLFPCVSDAEDAIAEGAPQLFMTGNKDGETRIRERGDIAKGFAESDVVVEETYRTSTEIHTPLETHASVAQWDGNKLTVWDSTQGVFDIQKSLAQALNLPLSSVRVIGHYMGGGFGSKLELGKYTVIAALLAKITARPVKICLSREESFLCTGNRPANVMKLKAGVKND